MIRCGLRVKELFHADGQWFLSLSDTIGAGRHLCLGGISGQAAIVAMVSDALLPFGKTVGLGRGGIVGLKILAHWQMKRPVRIDELPTSDFKRRRSDDVSSS